MKRIIIKSSGYIPFIQGNGPILKPVTITDTQFDTLKTMGFDIKEVGVEGQSVKTLAVPVEPAATEVRNPPSTVSEPEVQTVVDETVEEVAEAEETTPEEEVVEEVVEEEVVEEEVVEEEVVEEEAAEEVVEEEVVEEEVVEEVVEEEAAEEVVEEEILVDDEDLSAEAFYSEDFLTKVKAKVILEKRGVDFEGSANATELKQLVLDSNPEVSE